MDAIRYFFDALLQYLAVTFFLLRVLLPLARADSRNQFSQAVLRLTNPLVLPLRRVLPPIGKIDTASFAALFVVQVAVTAFMWLLGAYPGMVTLLAFLKMVLLKLIFTTLQFYTFALFIYVLISWVAPNTYSPAGNLLSSLCDPLLRPVRRVLPTIAGIDFSAVIVILGLQALGRLAIGSMAVGF
jgi:YggT family protein